MKVIVDRKDLAAHLGQTVTLRGIVARTKIPEILGVEIDSSGGALAEELAEATGVLDTYEAPEQPADGLYRAQKNPGRHYILRGDSGLAKPRRVTGA